jgi:putative transposase
MLEYKCDWQGKHLVFADKYYASSKMCNVCGYKKAELTLSEREWDCPICGTHHMRDQNAGINLVNFAKESLGISTVGITGIYASGEEETQVASMKEESPAFRRG